MPYLTLCLKEEVTADLSTKVMTLMDTKEGFFLKDKSQILYIAPTSYLLKASRSTTSNKPSRIRSTIIPPRLQSKTPWRTPRLTRLLTSSLTIWSTSTQSLSDSTNVSEPAINKMAPSESPTILTCKTSCDRICLMICFYSGQLKRIQCRMSPRGETSNFVSIQTKQPTTTSELKKTGIEKLSNFLKMECWPDPWNKKSDNCHGKRTGNSWMKAASRGSPSPKTQERGSNSCRGPLTTLWLMLTNCSC